MASNSSGDTPLSVYEDAVGNDEEELRRTWAEALNNVEKNSKRKKSYRLEPLFLKPSSSAESINGIFLRPSSQSSNSDHSSIEKIYLDKGGQILSKQSAGSSKTSGSKRRSTSGIFWNDNWNNDSVIYSLLYQLNQSLQIISAQLSELETTNTLQLRFLYRLIDIWIKEKKSFWYRTIVTIFAIPILLMLLSCPFILRLIKKAYYRGTITADITRYI